MPTDRENIFSDFEIPTLQFDEDDLVGVPLGKISADAEATFECEATINKAVLDKLIGLDRNPCTEIIRALGQSVRFTCKTPHMVQVRRHRKKRINKKWAKKYGYKYVFEPLTIDSVSLVQHGEEIDILGGRISRFPLVDYDFVGVM